MRKRHSIQTGTALTLGGLLLIAAALFLTVYNMEDAERARRESAEALRQIEAMASETGREASIETSWREMEEQTVCAPDSQREMPGMKIDDTVYIGTLEIPGLSLSLPVISQWSYSGLRLAPCRYKGSVYLDNLIIVAHNYPAHFGRLRDLQTGDTVILTDMEGTAFFYTVAETEILESAAVQEMEAGDWDLTLFTCTPGGRSRVTVRCAQVKDSP